MSAKMAARHDIQVKDPPTSHKLLSVTGEPLLQDGVADITITTSSASIDTSATVTPSAADNLIIGFGDLKRLRVIPGSFPGATGVKPVHACPQVPDFQAIRETLIKEYPEVLSDTLPDCNKAEDLMKIHLRPGDIRPTRVMTARAVPLHMQDRAERCVQKALKARVIMKQTEPMDWCSLGFFVEKDGPGSELRLVVDYTDLNKYVLCPKHTFPSCTEVISGLDPASWYFCKLDATSRYHQIPLDEESSKLTTFLLPSGRYCHRVAAMGMSCSSGEFCRRSNAMVEELAGIRKLVDDTLVQGATIDILVSRIRALLDRCKEAKFILSLKKFKIGTSLTFTGFKVGQEGVFPHRDKAQGIRDFATPNNVTELRSFLGMVNQMNAFYPYMSRCVSSLQALLKKDVAFTWLLEHEEAFEDIKRKLAKGLALHHFDSAMITSLITGASRTGIVFALIQQSPGGPRIIQCGSRSLTPAEKNYAIIELESLAIVWAIKKAKFYLWGMPHFDVIKDHRPLMGVFSKSPVQFNNHRLARIREKVVDFNFDIMWRPGKEDALSRTRYPVQAPGVPVVGTRPFQCLPASWPRGHRSASWPSVLVSAHLTSIREAITTKQKLAIMPRDHPALLFRAVWDNVSVAEDGLIIVEGNRIFVPIDARKEIIQELHRSQFGLEKTLAMAMGLYFWPGMRGQLK